METPGTFLESAGKSSSMEKSAFRMIDVGGKKTTARRAVASGKLFAAPATIELIRSHRLPKGNILALAEVAGMMGAKRTSDLLPLCHPLALDAVRVWCEVEAESVRVSCEASAVAKTGVEMEALSGVSAALLCIYDLVKGVDPALRISDIHLEIKEGGKSGVWTHPHYPHPPQEVSLEPQLGDIRIGVVTVSDRCSRGQAADLSGPAMVRWFEERGVQAIETALVPDEKSRIQAVVRELVFEKRVRILVLSGGTGLSPTDVTPEAVLELGGKTIPGLGEVLRQKGAEHTALSWLSRSTGLILGETIVVLLPGSPKAVIEGLDAVGELLKHLMHMVRGGNHDSLP
ncbi:bifunctional molybdenum cofactor biosynthesis protein MoaC/MoaB [Bdellovibrionota bacterium FG-1]